MRLAVLIPVFNAGTDLQRSLASLASDPYPFDIVVVDDGSLPQVVLPDSIGSHAVVLLRHDRNRGVAQALNTGLSWIEASGYDLVARLDAGDMNEPHRFDVQVDCLLTHPEIAIVGAWTRHLDETLEPLYTTRYPASWERIRRCFHYRAAFSHPACIIRTRVLREAGVYDERFVLSEDYELFWRIAQRFPCANVQEVLVTRVEDLGSLTHVHRLAAARMRLRLQWQHFAWARIDCWLGLARSVSLLLIPGRVALSLKRALGTIG